MIFPFLEIPLKILFEFAYMLTGNYGLSLIILSIVVNSVLLPVYKLAARWKAKEHAHQLKMKPDLDAIKMHYKGRERYYAIRTCYHIYKYHPLAALKVSLGLLIQIPFFLAAYNLLSHYSPYEGMGFLGIISDLSKADGLLWGINILPICMTIINILAGVVYAYGNGSDIEKKQNTKEFNQLFILSLFFLLVLYNAPAGLVLYWTMNNIYALIKYAMQKKPTIQSLYATTTMLFSNIIRHTNTGLLCIGILLMAVNYIFLYATHSWRTSPVAILSIHIAIVLLYIVLLYMIVWVRGASHKHSRSVSKTIGILGMLMSMVLGGVLVYMLKNEFISNPSHYNSPLFSITPNRIRQLTIAVQMMSVGFLLPTFLKQWHIRETLLRPIKQEMHTSFTSKTFQTTKKRMIHSLSMWGLIVFLFCFVSPLYIYFSEPAKISNSIFHVLPVLLGGSVAFLLFGGGIVWIIQKYRSLYYYFNAGLMWMMIIGVLFGFVISFNTNGMIGTYFIDDSIFMNIRPSLFIMETVGLVGLLYIILRYYTTIYKPLFVLMGVFFLFSIVDTEKTLYEQRDLFEKKIINNSEKSGDILPEYNDAFVSFSKEKNILLIVLDAFAADFIPLVLERAPELQNTLDGFTWYKNTVSIQGSTYQTLPFLIGGYNSKGMQSAYTMWSSELDDYDIFYWNPTAGAGGSYLSTISYLRDTFANTNATTENAGYTPYWKQHRLGVDEEDYTALDENVDYLSLQSLLAFTVFRLLPLHYKQKFYRDDNWGSFIHANSPENRYLILKQHYMEDEVVLDTLPHISNSSNKNKTFKIYWGETTHPDFYLNKDCAFSYEEILDGSYNHYSEENLINSHICSLERLGKWFEWMKKEGIYDNTKIVIVSDHGAFHTIEDSAIQYAVYDTEGNNIYYDEKYRNHRIMFALLMVKDFHQNGGLSTSMQLMSNADVPSILASGMREHNFPMLIQDPTLPSNQNTQRVLTYTRNGEVTSISRNVYDMNDWFD